MQLDAAGTPAADAATDAFAQGLNFASAVGAVVALVVAALVTTLLRYVPAGPAAGASDGADAQAAPAARGAGEMVLDPACCAEA